MKGLLLYLLFMNVLLFVTMGEDKRRAIEDRWRIRESTLFSMAILGGSIGGILGMKVFHHKTRHKKFQYGFPAILAAQLMLFGEVFARFFQ